jgi:hypothetical protein
MEDLSDQPQRKNRSRLDHNAMFPLLFIQRASGQHAPDG